MLLAAAFALALLAAVGGSRVGAQSGCRTTEDLGALSSHQTLTRTGLLHEGSCKFENVRYYDRYFFTMSGTGTVSVSTSAPDIRAEVFFSTEAGEYITGQRGSISRTLPAGRYRLLVISALHRDAGTYALTIKTGRIDAPRPLEPRQQGGCRTTKDLGALTSYQTFTRTELLHAGSCKFENVQYYDQYYFTMPGAGNVSVSTSAPDIRTEVYFNTESGEFIAGQRGSISRTFPAGRYRILIVSALHRDPGAYTVTIKTGKIDAPPPPPEPEQQELQPGAEQTQSAATAPGQIAVQVMPLPSGDQRGSYQVQFAFLTGAILANAASRSAAVAANQNLWPEPRTVRESTLRQRAQANDRRWMRSGLVTLPVPLSDGRSATLKGYVIARWASSSPESVRIEFAFLPERALRNANNDVQVAARAALIPDLHVLLESKITEVVQRGSARWFFSSSVNAPLDVSVPRQSITITPGAALSLQRGQSSGSAAIATVSAGARWSVTLSGLPLGLQYAPGPFPAGQGPINVFGTVLPSAEARSYTVGVTVRDESGQAQSTRVAITVAEPEPQALRIIWQGYLDAQLEVGGNLSAVRPQIVSPSPPPSSARIVYRSDTPSICTANPATGAISAVSAGSCQVTATATAPGYQSGTANARVSVVPAPKVTPTILWTGYGSNQATAGQGPLQPQNPQGIVDGRLVSLEFSYRAGSANVCRADRLTGILTLVGTGQCSVMVSSSATDRYNAASATVNLTIGPRNRPPRANPATPVTLDLDCHGRPPPPGPLISLLPLFSDPDRDDLTYSIVMYDSSIVTASVDNWFDTLQFLVADGVDTHERTIVRFRATDPGGLFADNEITVTVAPCPGPGWTVEGGDDGTDDDGIGVVDSPYDRGPYPP